MEHSVEQLKTLLGLSREIGIVQDLKTLLTHLDQAARKVLNCDKTAVFLYDDENDELYSTFATGEQLIRFSSEKGLAGQAFQTGMTINIPDAYADPRFNPEIDRHTGYRTRSLLTVPMRGCEGDVVAVFQLVNKRGGHFSTEDENLAMTFASIAGVVLQRQMLLDAFEVKQKMELEMQVARDIQLSLMPRSDPRIDGFDIAGWNKPADETGGDVYDFIHLPDGRLGILLADASGHGLGSALVAVQCRAIIHALFSTTENLDTIISQTNTILNHDLSEDRFVTVFLGILDPQTETIEYVSGGHAPIMYYSCDSGEERTKPATTQPLGFLGSLVGMPAEPILMQKGDLLILITDGFYEWENLNGEEFGTDRVFAVVRAYQNRSATEIVDALYNSVLAFGDGVEQSDDLTIVLVKKG